MSIEELNKLAPLWDSGIPLDSDRLSAFRTYEFAKFNAGELVYNAKLKGKSDERGMIWVVPIFKLFQFKLSSVAKVDDTGQVIAVTEESVRFPLPVSARILGLRSE